MYSEQQYKDDLALIERMDKNVSQKVVFLLYFMPLVACAVAHMLYLVLFAAAEVWAMVIFNVFSVSFYVVLIIFARKVKGQLKLVYASMAEIIAHATVATVYVGLKPDFCMFLLMIIPLAFLVPNKNELIPCIIMFISVTSYGILRFIYRIPGHEVYDISDSSYATVFFIINMVVGAFVMIYVAVIFTMMRRYQECKLRVQTEQLKVMASTDPLTKLNNRREMSAKLTEISSKSLNSGESYVIGLGDIDNFKRVNDTYGHDMGDEVLSKVADMIEKNIPEGGSASRWGGEEFLFVLPNAELEDGVKCSEDIISRISRERFTADSGEFSVTMTIGVCQGRPADNVEKVINSADSRLYKGKHSGKNRVEYSE